MATTWVELMSAAISRTKLWPLTGSWLHCILSLMTGTGSGISKECCNIRKGAIAAFTTAIRLDPGNVTAYTFRGIARVTLNDLPSGREDLRRALALDPTNAAALQWMAKLPKEP